MLKSLLTTILIVPFILSIMHGQNLQIPRSSPQASISQTIGVAKISIDYSRPSVKSRPLFGYLVPFDKVWRVGANEATVVTMSHDLMIEGKLLKAGKYALFMIPKKNAKWEVIFNSESNQWGAYNHDPEKDVLRVEVTAFAKPSHDELLTIHFPKSNKTEAQLTIDWGTIRIPIQIKTQTHEQTLAEIAKSTSTVQNFWYTYSAAAQYHYYERNEAEPALKYIDVAIALGAPNPAPWMLKSQILAAQGKYKEAIKLAEEAIEVSKKHNFWYELEENEEQIKKWRKLMQKK